MLQFSLMHPVLRSLDYMLLFCSQSSRGSRSSEASPYLATDMRQLREGMRNMAGKLSSMANDVYNAIPVSNVVVVVGYPTPSEGWGHGGTPWSPRSRATPQGLDQRL